MSYFVEVASNERFEQIKRELLPYKIERNAPGVVFAAKKDGVSITMYRSKKVLFQGKNAKTLGEHYFKGESRTTPQKKQRDNGALPPHFSSLPVLGSDETGTGDYFGPITVAACYVTPEQMEILEIIGVRDSKALTDDKMREMAPQIRSLCTHAITVLPIDHYNMWVDEGYSQAKIKAILHHDVLHQVRQQLNAHPITLIDQFIQPSTYFRYVGEQKDVVKENVYFATKAESIHLSVAAASILARVAFLEAMDELSKKVGYTLPKGASRKVDEVAAMILRSQGKEALQSVSKWHFKNTEKAYLLIKQ